MFLFAAIACTKKDGIEPVSQNNKLITNEKEAQHEAEKVTCPSGYMWCGHAVCSPYNTTYICSKDVNLEYTTTKKSSISCSCVQTSVAQSSHYYQVTWDSKYIATADKTGHTRSIDYKCFKTLTCNITCNQVKYYRSGWLAHRLNRPTRPNYCLDCDASFN